MMKPNTNECACACNNHVKLQAKILFSKAMDKSIIHLNAVTPINFMECTKGLWHHCTQFYLSQSAYGIKKGSMVPCFPSSQQVWVFRNSSRQSLITSTEGSSINYGSSAAMYNDKHNQQSMKMTSSRE